MQEINIEILKPAIKFFNKHTDIYNKFINNLKSYYIDNNKNIDIAEMKGFYNTYRMRIQNYRVIYNIVDGDIIIINVILAGKREDIYKKFNK